VAGNHIACQPEIDAGLPHERRHVGKQRCADRTGERLRVRPERMEATCEILK
jgi:hypothetical protein